MGSNNQCRQNANKMSKQKPPGLHWGAFLVPGNWQEREDSNPRPLVLETSALARLSYAPAICGAGGTDHRPWIFMVPLEGLEPPTRDLGRRRSIL